MRLFRLTFFATLTLLLMALSTYAQAPAGSQQPATSSPGAISPAGNPSANNASGTDSAASNGSPDSAAGRADAYYNFTMGHIYEQQYENTSKAEFATQAIDFYKKAYALDPKSGAIGERLAEMYWKAQRIHDAVSEAQEILKRDRMMCRPGASWHGFTCGASAI